MKTTQGREVAAIQIRVDNEGWWWTVDGEEWEMLCADDISKINHNLVSMGVVINVRDLFCPMAQNLCG